MAQQQSVHQHKAQPYVDVQVPACEVLGCTIIEIRIELFSVLRFESVIHEFDPYFNYRTTKYLADKGFYNFHNWFDDRAWYPLGRIIGGTIYPGLMVTASAIYHALNSF